MKKTMTYDYVDIFGQNCILEVEVLKNGLYFYEIHDPNDYKSLRCGGRVSKETFEEMFKKVIEK